MANEVEITITARDLTGPAFTSVMAKVASLKAALDAAFRDRVLDVNILPALAKIAILSKAAEAISIGHIDMNSMNTGLMALRQRIQALGIADIADVDVQPGRLMSQVQLIKRLIQQSGIPDLLDFNLSTNNLMTQLDRVGHVVEEIPVRFNVEKMPSIGTLGTEHVPVQFDVGKMPGIGGLGTERIPITSGDVGVIRQAEEAMTGLGDATHVFGNDVVHTDDAFSPFLQNILKIAEASKDGEKYGAGLGDAFGSIARGAGIVTSAIGSGLLGVLQALGRGVSNTVGFIGGLIGRGGGAGGGGGGGGLLGAAAAAGGAGRAFGFFGINLNASIGGIRLWHIGLDLVFESAVALGSALVALTIGIATMVPAAQDIYTHLKAVQTVNGALGSQIPPLTGQFDALSQSMVPQTIEAYGGAINLLTQNTGNLALVAHEVVTGIDDLIAKLDLWRSSQKNTGQILQDGVGFLHQFEGILGSVAGAISNLVKADPGTAHFLLDIVGAGAKLLDIVTRLPTPLLMTALGLHSIYLWGNVLSGVLGVLVKQVPGLRGLGDVLSKGFHLSMLSNPYVALTAGVIALGAAFAYMAFQGNMATNQVRGDINATNQALGQMSASQAIGALIQDITKYQVASANAFSPQSLANIRATTGSMQLMGAEGDVSLGHMANTIHDLGLQQWASAAKGAFDTVTGLFDKQSAVTHIAENNAAAYRAEIDTLVGSQGRLYGEAGKLMGQNYTLAQSFQIMDLAGVKFNDSSALMAQKVKNLITGYQNMSVSGGVLANSVNAVTFANLQQQSGVQDLISGWTTFFNMVSGGDSTFLSFANQVVGLYASMTTAGVKLNDSNGKVTSSLTGLASNAGSATISMTGLNTASIAAQQTFVSSAQAAQSNMNALTLMASASGLGTDGTNLLTQASKDYLSALLPAAANSQTMTSILYTLAQQGGYQGANSFKELSKWASNVANPMKDLQGITQILTQDSAGLTTDVQNLSTALGTTLNNAMAQVIFTESGGIGPMNALAQAIDQTGLNSGQTASAADNVASQFGKMTGSVNSAYGEFMTFAETALGLTKKQADVLWQQSLPSVQAAIDKLHGTTLTVKVDNSQALGAVDQARAAVAAANGQTANMYVNVIESGQTFTISAGGLLSPHAAGGIIGNIPRAATGGIRNGLALVGELGPEMVRLPPGSQVYPHGVTPGYASQGGDGSQVAVSLSIESSRSGQSAFDRVMLEWIRNQVRLKGGGNVQQAFGKNS